MSVQDCISIDISLTEHKRPQVRGKFIYVGDEKFYIRGVTYGTFRPSDDDVDYPAPSVVERDFRQMAANGLNALRTYTVPPVWLLDIAARYGLRVMVGLPWEQHVTFLNDRARVRSIKERVRAGVRACAGHPALLCYAIGNEIPASIVRWLGPVRVERFLEQLYQVVKDADPEGLVTYVNYPSTEYLDLPFVDLLCFNVYLESQESFEAYLYRLQNIAGDRPLVMAEVGLDSLRNGEEAQASTLDWQIRTAFTTGCAGMFVFAWTDEWHRGGLDVDDWDFGVTRRDRSPKPALETLRLAFGDLPPAPAPQWPRISVVVCTYNGGRTLRDSLEGLMRLDYPDYEVIVVDDGSSDDSAAIAASYPCRLISTSNRGLSNARNTGLEAATGTIVAYIDDDAYPDPHWLHYLAIAFANPDYAGVGGPNIAPPDDGLVAECVAHAPGGPVHVLLSDREAEHIAGCNMAFRKAYLQEIGGFDPQFRVAGDDVDICWRVQQRGWTIGFHPAAVVWHHRRSQVQHYWKQQQGYGRAEAMLERKWPERYNAVGHLNWSGRLYGKGLVQTLQLRPRRIYQGIWGSAPFQSVYQPAASLPALLLLMPEWYLILTVLAVLAALGIFWPPLLIALPLLVLGVSATLAQAGLSASHAFRTNPINTSSRRWKRWSLTTLLHLIQPLARLRGRLLHGLTPWRRRMEPGFRLPYARTISIWSEQKKLWRAPEQRLQAVEAALRAEGAALRRGGDFDRWDLEVRGGLFGAVRAHMVIEEHGLGRQFIRFRLWPCYQVGPTVLLLLGLVWGAASVQAWVPAALFGSLVLLLILRAFEECGSATAAALRAITRATEASTAPLLVFQQPHAARAVEKKVHELTPEEIAA